MDADPLNSTTSMGVADVPTPHAAWMMLGLGFLSQGAAYGMTFGLGGVFIGPVGRDLHGSRLALSLGPALVALLHGLLGPVVGRWLARGSIRVVMTLGALCLGSAFMLMHFAQSIWVYSLSFGLLGGAAVACLGITPVTTLVGRWFAAKQGRALGLANMPVLIMILPIIVGALTVHLGWRTTVLLLSLAALALVSLLSFVRDPPLAARMSGPTAAGEAFGAAASRASFRPDALFWMLAAAAGIFDGSGVTIITHFVPYATESGAGYQEATALVSIMGFCGMIGAPMLGLLADRMGGPRTMCAVAVLLASGWGALLLHPPYVGMVVVAGALGFCGGAFACLLGASLARVYQGGELGPAVGLAVLVALPFNFVLPLLAGYIHDRTGQYGLAILLQLLLFVIALAMLLVVARSSAYRRVARLPA